MVQSRLQLLCVENVYFSLILTPSELKQSRDRGLLVSPKSRQQKGLIVSPWQESDPAVSEDGVIETRHYVPTQSPKRGLTDQK